MGAASTFRWFKPEVYPVVGALGLGCCLAAYSMYHNMAYNGDVFLNRKRRSDWEVDVAKDQKQYDADRPLLRKLAAGHKPHIFSNKVDFSHLDEEK
ncbi:hypothetical protein WJX72_006965 [[Myrmecia] bisecta]|uniref:NADH dehydrogenase [ubiquinone] 1 alpha subcomplex subunit 1 n=1 Tax=[Myrmecia] bisecta TaxID=41462 RepID=A0AAW1Q7N6_9CHLO